MATRTHKSKGKETPKISPIHCPEKMSLEEWQRALRRQAAAKEYFGISAPMAPGDPFVVTSAKSGRAYRVEYFGAGSGLNRCECMDFKTSGLGTCKHIEAVSLAYGGKYSRKRYPVPEHTSVYVDYVDGRRVKVRRGSSATPGMDRLIATLFNADGTIRQMNCDPSEFIREARRLDEGFEWENDAMNLLIEARDRDLRQKLIAGKYSSTNFDGLLKTRLHPYQADGVRFAFAGGRTINADEMGLGKTVQAIATAELLRLEKLVESVIIVCPTSLKYQWLSEIRRFTDSTAMVVEGNVIRRREQLSSREAFYKICSFHAMSNTIKSGFVPSADMMIYDELQRLKNRDTQMGRELRKIQSRYVMALSGTPLENKLDELYSVTQLVDQYALGPYYKFVAETTLTDDCGRIIGYRNLHEVSERLCQTLLRRRKADVRLQMPPRTDTNLFVPMTKEQRAIHEEYKFQVSILIDRWRRFKFLNEADRKRLLLLLSMMRMVCDSTFIIDQKSRHDTKIDEIKAIIANLLADNDGKIVIFSQWERMLRILATELENEKTDFCFLHGGVPSPKRKDLIDRFRDDPDCRIFLSTDAGATGLNLQSASLLINIDLPWNPAVLEQRIARIYRLGQANPVQIINMIARDTIEERMLSTLAFKSNLAAGILDGGDDVVFLENSKFNRIAEVVDTVMAEPADMERQSPTGAPAGPTETPAEMEKQSPTGAPDAPTGPTETPAHMERQSPTGAPAAPAAPTETAADMERQSPTAPHEDHAAPQTTATEARDAVTAGLAALGKIADILRAPDGAKTLADALVKEDPATGRTSLNIPVPDKSTVVNFLTSITALLNR